MSKISVVYWSQTGNTQAMAEAIGNGIKAAGKEAEVVDELKPYVKSWISKNSTNTFHAQAFQEFLQEDLDYYQDIVVVGCCTDLCVLHFVLTLQTWLNEHNKKEYRIIVPKNCTETYDIPEIHPASKWNQVAWDMMQMNGVCVVDQLVD